MSRARLPLQHSTQYRRADQRCAFKQIGHEDVYSWSYEYYCVQLKQNLKKKKY